MKTRLLKSTILLVLICALVFPLTGCDSLDYREAIDLYNNADYAQAAEMFAQLGDYEDSVQLEILCRYWMGIDAMEAGSYEDALVLFEALVDYEDTADRITECRYQLAIAAFENDDLSAAEAVLLELADYRQTQEYLRRINWQKLYNTVTEVGLESGGIYAIAAQADQRTVSLMADLAEPSHLLFTVSWEKDMEYIFRDQLILNISRDSLEASFTAGSSFTMDYQGSQIGSQQAAFGHVYIPSCTPDTVLAMETFTKSVADNQGNTSTSEDPADATMTTAMQENYRVLMTTLPQLLEGSGIDLTLADIGFTAMQ